MGSGKSEFRNTKQRQLSQFCLFLGRGGRRDLRETLGKVYIDYFSFYQYRN